MFQSNSLRVLVTGVLLVAGAGVLQGQSATAAPAFDSLASTGLGVMREKATGMKVEGVAVVAYFEGGAITAWTSKMLVIGKMKNPATETSKGANLIAVAYSKAAEMADTLKDSGSGVRPPLNGEFGYQGGLIVPWRAGYLIVAFSGGTGAEDVAVARSGIERMAETK